MASYDDELLTAARLLLARSKGQRGPLPTARIRRSISTTYYAIFHFVLAEVGLRLVGSGNALRVRRRILARTISHTGAKLALDKLRGAHIEKSVADFFGTAPLPAPSFVRNLSSAFNDAYAKRQDADYDLNKRLSEADARILRLRVRRVIRAWRAANTAEDRRFKDAVCALILVKGKLRHDN